ncbi:MAG: hypothetical protein IT162_09790 [Bryobacterales bacterium]|nr:hypothetical protein [Bryobacterales bacterium]
MRWFLFLYFLRVPVLATLLLAALAPAGAFPWSPFRGLLEGLFDVNGWGAFWTGLASWLAAGMAWVASLPTLNYGPRRFAGLKRTATDLEFRAFPWLGATYALAPLSISAGLHAVSANGVAVALGSAAGFLAVALAGWLLLRRSPGTPRGRWRRRMPGYCDTATGRLLPGHLLAAQATAWFGGAYVLVGWLKYRSLREGVAHLWLPPSLAYVALLAGLLILILAGLAFFFDRYRVPVLLPWVALLTLAGWSPGADHTFPTTPATSAAPPAAVLAAVPRPILVCASGGGITAAVWTATVLSRLEEASPGRVRANLALFSAASGGSVGGLHFLANKPADAVGRAARSSLDAAAWGLVGPDLLRAAVPFAGAALGDVGRGWALERAWDVPLAAWPAAPPGVVFNATSVETGEGLALGNVNLAPYLRGHSGLAPVVAARLSASFPYVTPAPKPASGPGTHVVDGGYYDNYGVGAAAAFLRLAYAGPAAPARLPAHVLVIEIRASQSEDAWPAAEAEASRAPLLQWFAPALTILNVRDAAQRGHNRMLLDLLASDLARRGVTLERVTFELPRRHVPLSWHLTAAQRHDMEAAWRTRYAASRELAAVSAFVSSTTR